MSRKILFPIIIIVVVIAIGLIVYFFFPENTQKKIGSLPVISYFFPESEEIRRQNGEIKSPPADEINENGEKETQPPKTDSLPVLIQLTNVEVVGATFNEKDNMVRFVEKQTGHLYEIDPLGKNLKRISNTTIPNIFEISWSPNGKNAVLRYFKNEKINNFFASFTGSTTNGLFFSEKIKSILTSQNKKIYYLQENNSLGFVTESDFGLKNKRQIFISPFTDFVLIPEDKNHVGLLTKPSFFSKGFLYSLNTATKNYTKILGGIFGLNALWSKDGEKIFYTESLISKKGVKNKILDVISKKELNLNIKTFPEKCVWSKLNKNILYCASPINPPKGEYPDDWYQGIVQFNDNLWKINYKTGEMFVLFEFDQLSKKEGGIDVVNPFLSKDEEFLFFINKKDGSLWSLNLIN
jgi:hypothetical protein